MRSTERALLTVLALLPAAARAVDVEVDGSVVGQGYQVAAGDGSLVNRYRLTPQLGLHVWNFGAREPDGAPSLRNQFYFTMTMRLDTDLGSGAAAWPQFTLGNRDVTAELRPLRPELLWAHLGATDIGGFLDLRLGRMIDVDPFGFHAYDGLSVEAKTPFWFAVMVYGGLIVNGALPIDSPLYRPDGTARGGAGVHDGDYKPTVGVGVRSFGFRDLDARLTYRRVFSPGQNSTAAERATGATDGVTEEKLSWSARGRLLDGLIVPWFALRYDALVATIDHVSAGARFTLSPRHALQAEYLYAYPTFDGDSIWNLFARSRFDDARVGYDLTAGRVRGWVRGFARFFYDGDWPKNPLGAVAGGGNLGARLDLPRGFLRADVYADVGYGGRKIGADLSTRVRLVRELLFVEGRLTYVHFQDDVRAILRGDSLGIQLGARLHLGNGIALHLIAEDNINNYYRSQFRLYGVVDASVLLSPSRPRVRQGFASGGRF